MASSLQHEVTQMLPAWNDGDETALARLVPHVETDRPLNSPRQGSGILRLFKAHPSLIYEVLRFRSGNRAGERISVISDNLSTVHVFIQAGGHSSRMGTDKAWVEINGQPLIERVLAVAESVAASLSIIINSANPNADRYAKLAEHWNARLLDDLHDHQGPLGGIHTALENCSAGDTALILACDLPFLTSEFLALLCQRHKSRGALVTVPLDAEGRLQPLAAIYDQACLTAVEEQLAAGQLRVDRLFDVVTTARIAFSDFSHLPGASRFFLNLNSPEDLSFVVKPELSK